MIRYITIAMIVLTGIFWVAWDIYAYMHGTNSTISVVITDWAYYHPMAPFILGILMGHWLWPAKGSKDA